MISLSKALDQLSKGHFLDVVLIGYNRSTGKGGEIRRVRGRLLARYDGNRSNPVEQNNIKIKQGKKTNHYENATRDLQLENGSIMRFHIYLLVYVGDKKVI